MSARLDWGEHAVGNANSTETTHIGLLAVCPDNVRIGWIRLVGWGLVGFGRASRFFHYRLYYNLTELSCQGGKQNNLLGGSEVLVEYGKSFSVV